MGYAERMSTALKYEPTLLELLAAVPEHQTGELVNGALHVSPRPGPSHAAASFNLGVELGPPFERGRGGPGGWRILFEPELHLGETCSAPFTSSPVWCSGTAASSSWREGSYLSAVLMRST